MTAGGEGRIIENVHVMRGMGRKIKHWSNRDKARVKDY